MVKVRKGPHWASIGVGPGRAGGRETRLGGRALALSAQPRMKQSPSNDGIDITRRAHGDAQMSCEGGLSAEP
jgi:hypothetical protein